MNKNSEIIVFVALLIIFIAVRITLVNSPLNSDDNTYFEFSIKLSDGSHPILSDQLPDKIIHQALRFGILIPTALAIRIFGYNFFAYYSVPLFFSIIGFLLIIKINDRYLSRAWVLLIALIHIVYPFETRHSSLLLTDLPAALMVIGYIFYVCRYSENVKSGKLLVHSFIAALLLFWAYSLRDNQIILVIPAALILFFYKKHRRIVLLSLFCFVLLVMGEQFVYVWKGVEFGYRWKITKAAVDAWKTLLETVSYGKYFTRTFIYIFNQMGWLALIFYLLSIIYHVFFLFKSKDSFLRALLASGLFTYVLFAFYIFKITQDGITVFDYQHRYVQLFAYTSLIAVPLGLHSTSSVLRRKFSSLMNKQIFHPSLRFHNIVAFSFCLLIAVKFLQISLDNAGRLYDSRNVYGNMLSSVNTEMTNSGKKKIQIDGENYQIRAVSLFTNASLDHSIDWCGYPDLALISRLQFGDCEYYVRDVHALRWQKRLSNKIRRDSLDGIERGIVEAIVKNYHEVYKNNYFVLYKKGTDEIKIPISFPNMIFSLYDLDRQYIPYWTVMKKDKISFVKADNNLLRIDCNKIDINYILTDDGSFNSPPKAKQEYVLDPASQYLFLVDVDISQNVDIVLFMIEYDDKLRLQHSTYSLQNGMNLFTFTSGDLSKYFRIALRFSGNGSVMFKDYKMYKYTNNSR